MFFEIAVAVNVGITDAIIVIAIDITLDIIIVVVDIGIATNVDVTNDAIALWLSFPVFDKWL